MLEFISSCEYTYIKLRRTPYIVYFSKDDQFSKDVISTISKLAMSFCAVFCYTLPAPRIPHFINKNECCDNEHVYSICFGKIYKSAPATSYSELFQLFDSVYYDCLTYYRKGYVKAMWNNFGSEFRINNASLYKPDFEFLRKTQIHIEYPVFENKCNETEIDYIKNLPLCGKPVNVSSIYHLSRRKKNSLDKFPLRPILPKFPKEEIEFDSIKLEKEENMKSLRLKILKKFPQSVKKFP